MVRMVSTMERTWYAEPGALTRLTEEQRALIAALRAAPEELGRMAQGLVVSPRIASECGLGESRLADQNVRPASALIDRALAIAPAPLDQPRPPESRVVGTCRHFAVLACAFLRAQGVPARARCGFATYFVADKQVDHWITEYWSDGPARWVRMDAEILGLDVVEAPDDLQEGQFLSGGEAWQLLRDGVFDPMTFGVHGTEMWGIGEVRGNVLRDLAALNKVEMLPWDNWSSMDASYKGETGSEFDEVIDEVARVCASDDISRVTELYATLAVPAEMTS